MASQHMAGFENMELSSDPIHGNPQLGIRQEWAMAGAGTTQLTSSPTSGLCLLNDIQPRCVLVPPNPSSCKSVFTWEQPQVCCTALC